MAADRIGCSLSCWRLAAGGWRLAAGGWLAAAAPRSANRERHAKLIKRMKRLLLLSSLLLLAIASILLGQAPGVSTLRTPSGDKPLSVIHQGGQTYFAVDEVLGAINGTVKQEASGYKATLNDVVAAFGPESRFAVVRDDLVEMPVPPLSAAGKPYATIQFFQGYLGRAASLDATWDATARVLLVRPLQQTLVSVGTSLANIQGITKIVLTLSAPAEYVIVKEPGAYSVRFKSPIRGPYVEEAHDDANVSKLAFAGNDLRIQVTSPDVIADAYKLENPFRVVLDLRKGAAGATAPNPQLSVPTKPVDQPGIHTIVLDPGHGGKDVGAIGPGGTIEKDLTLAVSRKLASALAAKTGARIVLTREDDSVVSLDQRTAIANQYKADLFLSVHMNAAVVKGARGSETYFLSADASDELAKKAAESENTSASAAAAPSSDLKLILWDLAQQSYLQESSRFATDVQEEMNAIAGIQNRGVKQAPFKVLVGATMPAALVEVAFISNPDEEVKLKSDAFVTTVVDAITRAVVKYKIDYETRIGVIKPPPVAPAAPATTTTTTTTTTTAAAPARTGT
jgi:N-acetylmuramoyl-L-alanine amidase